MTPAYLQKRLGGIAGTLLGGPVERWLGRRWLIGLNILGNALMFAAPLLTANAWLMGIAIFFGGIGGPMWGVAALSLQQRAVPAHLQGRVFAAYRFISLGAEALGPAVGGLMAQAAGIRVVFLTSLLITTLMLWPFFQRLRGPAIAPADALHAANP